jgi:sterol O-acyltransferase
MPSPPRAISDSPVQVSSITGELDANGIATFEAGESISREQPTRAAPSRSLKDALDAAKNARHGSGGNTPESASEEDYDALQHDPLTVIIGGKGGGFDRDGLLTGRYEGTAVESRPDLQTPKRSTATPLKLKSIPITLKKADQKGQYFLIAEDIELREILKRTVEKVK